MCENCGGLLWVEGAGAAAKLGWDSDSGRNKVSVRLLSLRSVPPGPAL